MNVLAGDGAYIKLLQKDAAKKLQEFDNNLRYTIMFGPDRCGSTDKVHFILQHQNPVTKQWEEKVEYVVEERRIVTRTGLQHAKGTPASSAADKWEFRMRVCPLCSRVVQDDSLVHAHHPP